jgi:hypothetical protein
MLRITIELVPGGVGRPRELAQAVLGNVSVLNSTSDYQIRAREGDNPIAGTKAWERRGVVAGHDRRQSVWALAAKAAAWAAKEAEK